MGKEDSQTSHTFRRATSADYDFLYALHAASMREYVEPLWGWEETWQQEYFARKFDPQKYQIVQVAGRDAGVLVIENREEQLYLALIELLPEFQGRGLGTAIINKLLVLARERGQVVTLHVLKSNDPARRLYERLGFVVAGEEEHRFIMINETTKDTDGSIA